MEDIGAFGAPDEAELTAMEARLDFVFPRSYKDFLNSGSRLNCDVHSYPTSEAS